MKKTIQMVLLGLCIGLGAQFPVQADPAPAEPREIFIPAEGGDPIYSEQYGSGDHVLILVHMNNGRPADWKDAAQKLAAQGFQAVAVGMNVDTVLRSVKHFQKTGAKKISLIGASRGADVVGNAAKQLPPGTLHRVIMLSAWDLSGTDAIPGEKMFAHSKNEKDSNWMQDKFDKASEPKKLLVLEGYGHGLRIFKDETEGKKLFGEIVAFLKK